MNAFEAFNPIDDDPNLIVVQFAAWLSVGVDQDRTDAIGQDARENIHPFHHLCA